MDVWKSPLSPESASAFLYFQTTWLHCSLTVAAFPVYTRSLKKLFPQGLDQVKKKKKKKRTACKQTPHTKESQTFKI